MKNKLLIILTCLSVFLIIPFGLYWIFITPSQIGIIRAVDTGSWLGYYGAIIGGAVTLLGVYWTIINQEKLRKEDIALHEKRMKQEIAEIELRRLEDRRMSIYPYFSYYVNEKQETEKTIFAGLWISAHSKNTSGQTNEQTRVPVEIGLKTKIIAHNAGLGIAVNPYIIEILYDGATLGFTFDSQFNININEMASIPLNLELPELSKLDAMILKLGYFNILHDFYEQTVTLEFVITPTIYTDIGKIEDKCTGIRIVDVSQPILSKRDNFERLSVKHFTTNNN